VRAGIAKYPTVLRNTNKNKQLACLSLFGTKSLSSWHGCRRAGSIPAQLPENIRFFTNIHINQLARRGDAEGGILLSYNHGLQTV